MRTIIFVYNATSDVWSKYMDIAHKIISPSTYSCNLCSLTHGNFSEKKVWKDFRKRTAVDMIFMYKNEFLKVYGQRNCSFPVVFEKKNDENLRILFDSEELTSLKSVNELIESLQVVLAKNSSAEY